MDVSVVFSRAQVGMHAPAVEVETHLANGLPCFSIVGLPEAAVRESRERVRAAIVNSHFDFPSDRRITVNLAPADLPKEGGRFDLPIALGILSASGQVPTQLLNEHEFVGELALNGRLRPVPAVVTAALAAAKDQRKLVVPADCAEIAAQVPQAQIIPADNLLRLCAHLNQAAPIEFSPTLPSQMPTTHPDLADVSGQASARRALEIAAAGGHHLLFCGPPGTGKTMLASRLPGILPPASTQDRLTSLALRNIHHNASDEQFSERPFRAPHHSASAVSLVGGGAKSRPGEISLAHSGVLFLDELPEFPRHTLEMLREPLESGHITVSRANLKVSYPARFQLVAAMNPCPCGYRGDADHRCSCSSEQLARYSKRISGPLLDRIDIFSTVNRPPLDALMQSSVDNEDSAAVRLRVEAAHAVQIHRQGVSNALLDANEIKTHCSLDAAIERQLYSACHAMKISARGLHRLLRVARTIADLDSADALLWPHIAEALALRQQNIS